MRGGCRRRRRRRREWIVGVDWEMRGDGSWDGDWVVGWSRVGMEWGYGWRSFIDFEAAVLS